MAIPPTGAAALPPIDPASVPAEVRNGSKEDKQAFRAALGFEHALLTQLTKSMADTAKSEEQDGESAATQMYKDMLPERLADSMISGGGIGLAENLYRSVRQAGQ